MEGSSQFLLKQLDPGSCQAVRIAAILEKPVMQTAVTPKWREQNERGSAVRTLRGLSRNAVPTGSST
jgi:hypothetical protein